MLNENGTAIAAGNEVGAFNSGTGNVEQPGHFLRKLREAKGITLEEIHDKTLIPVWKLRALEEDDYETVGSRLFATGYVKQVSKQLGTDPEPLIEAIKIPPRAPSAGPVDKVDSEPLNGVKKGGNLFQKLWSPWVIVVLVLLWIAATWIFNGSSPSNVSNTDEASEELSLPEPIAQVVTEPEIDAEGSVENAPELDQSGLAEGGDEVSDDLVASPGFEASDSTSTEEAPLVEVAESDPTEELSTSVQQEQPEPPEVDGGGQEDQLSMTFTEKCWVEVKDVNGKVLFAQIQNKGDNLQLFGEGPFSVMLGNANAVSLLVNGRSVSTEPTGNRKTLRLLVTP